MLWGGKYDIKLSAIPKTNQLLRVPSKKDAQKWFSEAGKHLSLQADKRNDIPIMLHQTLRDLYPSETNGFSSTPYSQKQQQSNKTINIQYRKEDRKRPEGSESDSNTHEEARYFRRSIYIPMNEQNFLNIHFPLWFCVTI